MKERITFLKKRYSTHVLAARAVNSYGPFEQAAELRGREDFYMDLALNPELARLIVDKCSEVIVRAQTLYLYAVGKELDFFEIPGDDYGTNDSLMISPSVFSGLFEPALKRIIGCVKDFNPGLPVAFHSDGAISEIIPGLIDAGVDILNPLEPLPAVDWGQIKRSYSDRLCFMGGVDIREALTRTGKEVEEDVRRCLRTFAGGGGYILTAANHIHVDVPSENVVAMFESGKRLGRYPLEF